VILLARVRSFLPLAVRLWREDEGQDLLEYALLTGIVGVSGIVLYTSVAPAMGAVYESWNGAQEDIWEPNPPLLPLP
jgi:Flp pilus assembly pilin Flp